MTLGFRHTERGYPDAPFPAFIVHGASCNEYPVDLFFPERGANTLRDVRQICKTCPVQAECLEYALDIPWLDGVWGGTTRRERVALRLQQGRYR